jgi:hypothetical protein
METITDLPVAVKCANHPFVLSLERERNDPDHTARLPSLFIHTANTELFRSCVLFDGLSERCRETGHLGGGSLSAWLY